MVRAGEGLCLDNFETGFLGETFTNDDLGQGRSCNDNLNIYVHCLVLAILTMTHLMMVIHDAGRNDDDGDGDDGDDESKEGQYNPN